MSFALDLRRFADKTSAKCDAVVRKIIIDVGTSLVLKSPVGDAQYWQHPAPKGYVGGRFRANWQYNLDAPTVSTTEAIDPEGTTTISAIVGKVGKGAGHKHYITNSLPYAIPLEEGHSYRQAPEGMVGITVLEFEPIVAAAAEALK
jgi:hypothetical protein